MPLSRSFFCAVLVVLACFSLWRGNWGAASCSLLLVVVAELMTIREALTKTTNISLR